MDDIRERIEALIARASNGVVTVEGLRVADGSLIDAGMTSVGILAVIEGLEAEFAIVIEMTEDPQFLMNVGTIAEFVRSRQIVEVLQ